ncbi:MAG: Crp/Fnr family transcriptional regulator [Gammaproteobacteria bacterium]|nr:Crp/Fnr family transcriptional regulator [Gammaproteobacteria bacterium]MDH5730651.1 Crp/Fnr family transcriptional regulator [Gammaproteobacteria bacterium]
MVNKLIQFLSNYASFTDEEINIIREQCIIQTYSKGTILLSEGQVAKNSYLVLQGCVRSYYVTDAEEKNTAFFIENDLIIPVSYINNTPSAYYIECLEDCSFSIGSHERTQQFTKKYPKLALMCNKINEDIMAKRQIAWDRFHSLSPEAHYVEMLNQKSVLLTRISQYHLASYLGIKPQSLSRIRKRLAEKA